MNISNAFFVFFKGGLSLSYKTPRAVEPSSCSLVFIDRLDTEHLPRLPFSWIIWSKGSWLPVLNLGFSWGFLSSSLSRSPRLASPPWLDITAGCIIKRNSAVRLSRESCSVREARRELWAVPSPRTLCIFNTAWLKRTAWRYFYASELALRNAPEINIEHVRKRRQGIRHSGLIHPF